MSFMNSSLVSGGSHPVWSNYLPPLFYFQKTTSYLQRLVCTGDGHEKHSLQLPCERHVIETVLNINNEKRNCSRKEDTTETHILNTRLLYSIETSFNSLHIVEVFIVRAVVFVISKQFRRRRVLEYFHHFFRCRPLCWVVVCTISDYPPQLENTYSLTSYVTF